MEELSLIIAAGYLLSTAIYLELVLRSVKKIFGLNLMIAFIPIVNTFFAIVMISLFVKKIVSSFSSKVLFERK